MSPSMYYISSSRLSVYSSITAWSATSSSRSLKNDILCSCWPQRLSVLQSAKSSISSLVCISARAQTGKSTGACSRRFSFWSVLFYYGGFGPALLRANMLKVRAQALPPMDTNHTITQVEMEFKNSYGSFKYINFLEVEEDLWYNRKDGLFVRFIVTALFIFRGREFNSVFVIRSIMDNE